MPRKPFSKRKSCDNWSCPSRWLLRGVSSVDYMHRRSFRCDHYFRSSKPQPLLAKRSIFSRVRREPLKGGEIRPATGTRPLCVYSTSKPDLRRRSRKGYPRALTWSCLPPLTLVSSRRMFTCFVRQKTWPPLPVDQSTGIALAKATNLRPQRKILMAQTVGYPKKGGGSVH